ncbi:MAG: urease accessory protein UreF [Cellvibrionales bacterium]|nr:urease accessory protein UreF [Cellvibrionales bacterium]
MDDTALLRLLQLVNPNLPIGGFTYSQGAEWACEAGWLQNKRDAYEWLLSLINESLVIFDLPLLLRLFKALDNNDLVAFSDFSQLAYAGRETDELRLEDTQCAEALVRVLNNLNITDQWSHWQALQSDLTKTLLAPFAMAGINWHISLDHLLQGFLWAWLESRVAALIKLVPLGQSDGQWLLYQLSEYLPQAVLIAKHVSDEEIGSAAFGMVIASCQHETQYCRLFRS